LKLAAIALIFLPTLAHAQVYKCVAADGSTTYATVPCPEGTGQTTRIIEPVPPSGVLNVPAVELPVEQQPAEPANKTASPVSGLTVIPDSEDPHRETKRTEMREDAEQHKRDMYQDFERQQNEKPVRP